MNSVWGEYADWRIPVRQRLYGATTPGLTFVLDRLRTVDFRLVWLWLTEPITGVPGVRYRRGECCVPAYQCETCRTVFVGSSFDDLEHTCTEN